jgi:hypothetical protein
MSEISTIANLRIEQYKAYMQDVANIGSRHETARAFYLSVLSALLAFVALAGKDGPLSGIGANLFVVISLGAIAICLLWFLNTLSFAALYHAKLGQLHKMEEKLPFQMFTAEHEALIRDWKYFHLTTVECLVAWIFIALFIAALVLNACVK